MFLTAGVVVSFWSFGIILVGFFVFVLIVEEPPLFRPDVTCIESGAVPCDVLNYDELEQTTSRSRLVRCVLGPKSKPASASATNPVADSSDDTSRRPPALKTALLGRDIGALRGG